MAAELAGWRRLKGQQPLRSLALLAPLWPWSKGAAQGQPQWRLRRAGLTRRWLRAGRAPAPNSPSSARASGQLAAGRGLRLAALERSLVRSCRPLTGSARPQRPVEWALS